MLQEDDGDSPDLVEIHTIECAQDIVNVYTAMSETVANEIDDAACSEALKTTTEYKCVKLAV